MTRPKQTIYKTPGGCFRVGQRYFKYYEGALNESTKEECKGLGQETFLVDDKDVRDAIESVSDTVTSRGPFTNRRLY
jgi:hypothetical protein